MKKNTNYEALHWIETFCSSTCKDSLIGLEKSNVIHTYFNGVLNYYIWAANVYLVAERYTFSRYDTVMVL